MHDALLLGAGLFYLAAAFMLYRALLKGPGSRRGPAIALSLIGVLLHAGAQYTHWITDGAVEISFLNVLSLSAMVVAAIVVISSPFKNSLFDAGLIALPLAAVVAIAEWGLHPPGGLLENASTALGVHITSSILAFGLLSLAGFYALFVTLIDHFLRRHHLNPLVRALPPLSVLEKLLFRLIGAGFVLLTLSLATGLLFVDDLFAQHLAHKSILAITAWLVFGTLLAGRVAWGWRGRTAVRMTLAGVLILVLAYFGSKLVLEVLLGTSWGS